MQNEGDKNTLICGAAKFKCCNEADNNSVKKNIYNNKTGCNCLPACTTINFDIEISSSEPRYYSKQIFERSNISFMIL